MIESKCCREPNRLLLEATMRRYKMAKWHNWRILAPRWKRWNAMMMMLGEEDDAADDDGNGDLRMSMISSITGGSYCVRHGLLVSYCWRMLTVFCYWTMFSLPHSRKSGTSLVTSEEATFFCRLSLPGKLTNNSVENKAINYTIIRLTPEQTRRHFPTIPASLIG